MRHKLFSNFGAIKMRFFLYTHNGGGIHSNHSYSRCGVEARCGGIGADFKQRGLCAPTFQNIQWFALRAHQTLTFFCMVRRKVLGKIVLHKTILSSFIIFLRCVFSGECDKHEVRIGANQVVWWECIGFIFERYWILERNKKICVVNVYFCYEKKTKWLNN